MDRARLTAERDLIRHQVDALTEEFDAIVASTDLVSTDDEHDPDGATIAFERAMVASLLEQARRQRDELDAALTRMADGSYGRCAACGRAITAERLEALPATTACIDCAQRRS